MGEKNNLKDKTGLRKGKLVAVRVVGRKDGFALWECQCDCGNTTCVQSRHVGRNVSCGCLSKFEPGIAALNALYAVYKKDARYNQREFLITLEDFKTLTKSPCRYCGEPPTASFGQGRYNGDYVYNGVDRIDNTRGYSLDNCGACCSQCNKAKSNLTEPEFLGWVKRLAQHQAKLYETAPKPQEN